MGIKIEPEDLATQGSLSGSSLTLEGGTYDTTIAAGSPSASVTYVLPAADGSSAQVLATDGSGSLSWATVAGGGGSVDHGALTGLADDDHTHYLKADGTRGVSANWDIGSYSLTAQTLISDVAIGTAPMTITSTTVVSNLNVDQVDGYDFNQDLRTTASPSLVKLTATGGTVTLGASAQTGTLEIYDGSAHKISITSPSISANYTLTLPTTDGTASQYIKTDGSGNLSWDDPTGSITLPGSSTDHAIVRWDGAGGATIQDSSVIVDDSDNIACPGTMRITGATAPNLTIDSANNAALYIDRGDSTSYTTEIRLRTATVDKWKFGTLNSSGDEDLVFQYYDGSWNNTLVADYGTGDITIANDLAVTGDGTINDLTISTPSNIYALSHDSFTDFVTAEHYAWAADVAATTIHADNISSASITQHEGDITLDNLGTPDDNTDLNVSTSKHGLCPKLSNSATQYLNGTGSYSTPATTGIYINVEDYGSVQAAITAASNGDTIYFPESSTTYDVSATLSLSGKNYLTFMGDNKRGSIIRFTGSGKLFEIPSGGDWWTWEKLGMYDQVGGSGTDAIYFTNNVTKYTIRDCKIGFDQYTGFTHGIRHDGVDASSEHAIIEANEFVGNTHAIYMDYYANILNINKNSITSGTTHGANSFYGIYIYNSSATFPSANINITGNAFQQLGGGYAVKLYSTTHGIRNARLTGNYFENCVATNGTIDLYNCYSTWIEGNHLDGGSAAPAAHVYSNSTLNTTVVGNTFIDSTNFITNSGNAVHCWNNTYRISNVWQTTYSQITSRMSGTVHVHEPRMVAVDGDSTPGFLGASSADGVLRVDGSMSYTDNGDYITLGATGGGGSPFTSIVITDDVHSIKQADASSSLTFSGGIYWGDAYGGSVGVYGNSHGSTPGRIWLLAGDVAGSQIRFSTRGNLAATLDDSQALAVTGCVTDGTCEIMLQRDGLSVIEDILHTGSGTMDKHGHERMDLKAIHDKYPYLIHKNDDGYYDKLGAKSDITYVAVKQLHDKIKNLENKIKALEGNRNDYTS